MIERERLVVPREHLGILVQPAPEQIHVALARSDAAGQGRAELLGRPLSEWRERFRRRLALTGPVVVTGHQMEFYHVGVFAKTIAAHTLAARNGSSAVFLCVDCDLPKTQRLAVPEITGGGLRRVEVAIPACDPQRPLECQPRAPHEHWLDFFVRVASIYEHYDACLMRSFAEAWLSCDELETDYCEAIARGWAAVEETLGLDSVRRIRLSRLCATPEFRAFAAHLILHAPRSAHAYNAAQAAYRGRHRIRTLQRPVPPLATPAGWTEVPLWVFRAEGTRQQLYVVDGGQRVGLYAGAECIGEMPRAVLASAAAHAEPWPLEQAGWRLRPRALALSAFARLFIADLFIHGIGGTQYDEVTDEWVRGVFEVELAPIACVSATAYLPLPRTGVRPSDVLAARHASRDVRFNPQRYVRDPPAELLGRRAEMIRRSDELRAQRSRDRGVRRLAFDEIRRVNDLILQRDPWRPAELDQRVQTLEHSLELDRVALEREYFAALHLNTTLDELATRLRAHFELSEPRP